MRLEDSLDLGPLLLPLWAFAVLLAAVALKLTLRLAFRGAGDASRTWEDRVWVAVLIGFGVWKLSPLVASFPAIRGYPLALLYLPGSTGGLIAGLVAGFAWLVSAVLRHQGPKKAIVGALGRALSAAALAVFAFAAALGLVAASTGPAPAARVVVMLPTLDGRSLDLTAAPGKVLFVNFWATWCPPCRAEIPGLVEFWKQADKEGVELRAVDLTSTEPDPAGVAAFVRSQGMDFPILMDGGGEAAAAFGITTIPTTLVFDPEGRLVAAHKGVMTKGLMRKFVRRHGPGGSPPRTP